MEPWAEPRLDVVRLYPAEPFPDLVRVRMPPRRLDRLKERAFVLVQASTGRSPAEQGVLVEVLGAVVADRHDHFDLDAVDAQRLPEEQVIGSPVVERPAGSVARVGEDETHAAPVDRDGVEGDLVQGAVPEAALRQVLLVVSAFEEVQELLLTGSEPVRVGMGEQAVEGEQAAPEEGRRSETALVGVLDAEGAVEASPVDMSEALRGAPLRERMFPGDAGPGEALHEASRGVLVPVMPAPVLEAGEDAGVEADQGEPVGVVRRPSEGLHRGRPVFEVGHGPRAGYSWLEWLCHGPASARGTRAAFTTVSGSASCRESSGVPARHR